MSGHEYITQANSGSCITISDEGGARDNGEHAAATPVEVGRRSMAMQCLSMGLDKTEANRLSGSASLYLRVLAFHAPSGWRITAPR